MDRVAFVRNPNYSFSCRTLFINFIGLIIRLRLLRLMKESDLIKDFTVDGLLLELLKIKKIQLVNGEIIVSEITKKQRTILDALHLCA